MDKPDTPMTAKEIDAAIRESKAYVKENGGKSAEGFVRTPTGPKSIDDEESDDLL